MIIAFLFVKPALFDHASSIATLGNFLEVAFLVVSGICAFILFRRSSILASTAVFAMTITEISFRFFDAGSTDVTVPVMALLFSAQALRGSIVAKHL
jgi:hypothetical protein